MLDLAIVTSIPQSSTDWAYTRGFVKRLINSYLTIGPDRVRVRIGLVAAKNSALFRDPELAGIIMTLTLTLSLIHTCGWIAE